MLKVQLAQMEATLAWERSEHATVKRQLADALLAIELTHSEVAAMTTRRGELQDEVSARSRDLSAARHDIDSLQQRLRTEQEEHARLKVPCRFSDRCVSCVLVACACPCSCAFVISRYVFGWRTLVPLHFGGNTRFGGNLTVLCGRARCGAPCWRRRC